MQRVQINSNSKTGPLDREYYRGLPDTLYPGTLVQSQGALSDIGRKGSSHAAYTRAPLHWPLNDTEARSNIEDRISGYVDFTTKFSDLIFQFSWGSGPTLEHREGIAIYALLRCSLPRSLTEGAADIPLGYVTRRFDDNDRNIRIVLGGLLNVQDRSLHRRQNITGPVVTCSFMDSFKPCSTSLAPPVFELSGETDAINFALKGGMS